MAGPTIWAVWLADAHHAVALDDGVGHQCRQEGRHRRDLESAHGTDQQGHSEDGVAPEPARSGAHEQDHDRDRQRKLADADDDAPVEPVGGIADRKRQRDQRQELGEANQAEIERAARQRVELPADRHGHDVERDRRRHPGAPEPHEPAMAQNRLARVGILSCHSLFLSPRCPPEQPRRAFARAVDPQTDHCMLHAASGNRLCLICRATDRARSQGAPGLDFER